jgi:hypothetical protein
MSSIDKESQIIQAYSAIEQFTKLFAKNYPLVFKDGAYTTKVYPDTAGSFPYEVLLEIKIKK